MLYQRCVRFYQNQSVITKKKKIQKIYDEVFQEDIWDSEIYNTIGVEI